LSKQKPGKVHPLLLKLKIEFNINCWLICQLMLYYDSLPNLISPQQFNHLAI